MAVKKLLSFVLLCCIWHVSIAQGPHDMVEAFAQDPAMGAAAVSPDGKYLGTLQRFEKDGKQHLLIYEVADLDKRPVTLGSSRMDIVFFAWANSERLIVRFRQDVDTLQEVGADTRLVYKLAIIDRKGKSWLEIPRKRADRRRKQIRAVEDFGGARVFSLLPRDDRHLLIEYDDDKNGVADIYKVDIETGSARRIARNSTRISISYLDEDEEPRLATRYDAGDAAIIYLARMKGDKEWVEIGRTEPSLNSVSQLFGAFFLNGGPESNEFFVLSNHENDTAGIYLYDLEKRSFGELQFLHPRYDATGIRSLTDLDAEHGRKILGFSYSGKSSNSVYLTDPQEEAFYASLEKYFRGQAAESADSVTLPRREDAGGKG